MDSPFYLCHQYGLAIDLNNHPYFRRQFYEEQRGS